MEVAVGVFTPPLPEASRSETTFCFEVQLKLMENQIQIQESRTDGPHAQQEALLEGAEMQRTQALECLEKLTLELHEFVKSKVNIHKEIKTMTTSVTAALGRFKRMDEQWRSMKQRYLQVAPERAPASTSSSCVPLITISPSTEADMDMGSEADCESLAKETLLTTLKATRGSERSLLIMFPPRECFKSVLSPTSDFAAPIGFPMVKHFLWPSLLSALEPLMVMAPSPHNLTTTVISRSSAVTAGTSGVPLHRITHRATESKAESRQSSLNFNQPRGEILTKGQTLRGIWFQRPARCPMSSNSISSKGQGKPLRLRPDGLQSTDYTSSEPCYFKCGTFLLEKTSERKTIVSKNFSRRNQKLAT
ncbi:hypothetical protein J6590_021492 [Homalodisca vitripennis]|nr:hypothetical protein J6590_021492 [Homalodisca vitripennis]